MMLPQGVYRLLHCLYVAITLLCFSVQADPRLGQKLMLDIRYFCQDGISIECREPVKELPLELREWLQKYQIGGVILFAENIHTSQQLIKLTQDLQLSMSDIEAPPLFIAVDQEGGRVARLPQHVLPAFSGSMALGATYASSQDNFARAVAEVQAQKLLSHGINVNFAPVLDVNSNPENPVINVRAFGSDPEMVAVLGSSMVKTYQDNGILSAIKHFPGHGDTQVDSHTGLPQVTHSLSQIMQQDIAPFAHVINNAQPAFVMTAHIQFPNLDDTKLSTLDGASIIVPATFSRKILHDVLREQLGFDGIIISDALDMAGIADHFASDEALLNTFAAGSDIALMPFAIRTPDDIVAFDSWFRAARQALSERMQETSWQASLSRIATQKISMLRNKHSAITQQIPEKGIDTLVDNLAMASVTALPGSQAVTLKPGDSLFAVMPDDLRCAGLRKALYDQGIVNLECISTLLDASLPVMRDLDKYHYIILGELSPAISAVEMGGMDDVVALRQRTAQRASATDVLQYMTSLLTNQELANRTILVGLRAPYVVRQLTAQTQPLATFLLYDYRVDETTFTSPSLKSLSQILTQGLIPTGTLPVD